MSDFLPRDSKGRIQIRIWLVLIWLAGMAAIIPLAFLVLGPPGSGGGPSDSERGRMVGMGAALMSFWVALIGAGAIWLTRWYKGRSSR